MTLNTSNQLQNELIELATRLDKAKHGTKGKIKESFMAAHNWSLPRLHRELQKVGWRSGRKKRIDSGSTCVDEHIINELGGMLKTGVRKNGKVTMETPNALSILKQNGRDIKVGPSRMNQLLRQRKLSLQQQKVPTPNIRMRSLHPNHVHQVDPSLCLLYYTPNGIQREIRDDQLYKNKPEFGEKIKKLKCWRYVLADHFSGSILVRYYQSAGESTENLYDFLLYCWEQKEGRVFHGVPKLMVWDKGSANTSSAIKTALNALQVETYEHKAGSPRVKGLVENANNLVEKLFESRLRYEPVQSVDELNKAVEAWTIAYNTGCVPHYDSRLKRIGMTKPLARWEIWQTVRKNQLRLLPDRDICKYLLSSEPKQKQVRADLKVSFKHPVAKRTLLYSLSGIDGVYPKSKVLIAPLIYGDHEIVVTVDNYKDEPIEHVVKPELIDEFSGMPLDAPVWGDEQFVSHKETVVEKASKAAEKSLFPELNSDEREKAIDKGVVPFGGLDTHSHLSKVKTPDYMERKGTSLNVPDRFEPSIEILSVTQICMSLVKRYGMTLTPNDNQFIRQHYADGVAENNLEAVRDSLSNQNQEKMRLIK